MSKIKTIRVTGKGRIKIKPDMTRITLTLEGTCRDYGETLAKSAKDTGMVRELLTGIGFEPSDLKTLQFSVDTEYEGYQEDGIYKQRFKGYRFRHVLKMEFPSDNERLGRILYALANCPVNPEFQISFTVRDREAAKNELLGKAVIDAKEKAAVLAQAAGVRLGEIRSIDYSWGEIDFEVRPMNRMMMADAAPMAAKSAFDMSIEPDDIDVSDTVTVVWGIG
jgi:uncharacterized protein YggE